MEQATAHEVPQPESEGGRRLARLLGTLWQHRDFRKLWIGQTVSLLGSQVTLFALPLTATATLGASAGQMGLLFAAETAANAAVVLFAGAWVERVRKRPILIWANIGRAALLATIPLAALADLLSMAQLYVVAVLAGLLSVFFSVAYSPYLVSLVSRDRLVEANSKLEMSRAFTTITGDGLAGVLVQVMAAPLAIAVDAVSFVVSSLFLRRIEAGEPAPEPPAQKPSIRREIGEGLRFTWGHPLLRPAIVAAGCFNLFGSLIGALYILFFTEELGLPPGLMGVTGIVEACAALLGGLVAGRVTAILGLGPTMLGALLVSAVGTFLIPLAREPTWFALVCLFGQSLLFGFSVPHFSVGFGAMTQAATPDPMLARMGACTRFVVLGSLPLGALAAGVLGQALGIRPALTVAAVGTLLGALVIVFSPLRSQRALPRPVDATADLL